MKKFSNSHPIIFTILLFFVALIIASPMSAIGSSMGGLEIGGAIGRIIVGCALIIIFWECFRKNRLFSGIKYMIPTILFPIWNVMYHLFSGMMEIHTMDEIAGVLILGIAPAIFEEVIFRGIMIDKLRQKGKSDVAILLLSAIVFGAIHLTNIAGVDLANVLLQTGYAFVVGLVFGAIYIKSNDILSVMIAHALIDISSQIFVSNPINTDVRLIVVFGIVLLIEAVYAIRLVVKKKFCMIIG